jgi:L-arabinokinase
MTEATGEAPGRLDLLGGVADYSGSLVLETPIHGRTRVTLQRHAGDTIRFESRQAEDPHILPLSSLDTCLKLSPSQRRDWLDENKVPSHVRYLFGCLLLVAETKGPLPQAGLNIAVESTVPIAMGVSSSAALEVACLKALQEQFHLSFKGTELARLAQRVENEVVGAPCGLMDQLTCDYGVQDCLLPILCRPDHVQSPLPPPSGICVAGWVSGVEHDVSGVPYATARCATFMGFEIFKRITGDDWQYPSEIPLGLFNAKKGSLPMSMTGRAFLRDFDGITDPLSTVIQEYHYPVRNSLRFPIEEHHRVTKAVEHLRSAPEASETLCSIGEAMYASHDAYGQIGLGNPATDEMVALVRSLGPANGCYGARVSGGGCGGTVVVLMKETSLSLLDSARRAQREAPWMETAFIL